MRLRVAIAACLLLTAPAARAQSTERFRAMNRPVEPFRIIGNVYYVGASSVTAFLIVTPDGHVLIDGGFPETVPLIRKSIAELGFELTDVRILLNSHAHFDHAGGLAELKRLSGAQMMASEREAALLERGGRGDDLMGDEGAFEPVEVDRRLKDGDTVELGGVRLVARLTAGHTRGCTSWVVPVEEDGREHTAVSICSLTVLRGVRFHESPTYPGIAQDFERSFDTLRGIEADVFLASHAEFFRMADKRTRLVKGETPNPFIDPAGYRAYLDRAEKRFKERLAAGPGP